MAALRASPIYFLEQVWNETWPELVHRTQFVGGSFFEVSTLPTTEAGKRDLYVMRSVLHDWNDARTSVILSNIRLAMGASISPCCSCKKQILDFCWN